MRISLLLKREPFGEILEKTLSRFWKAQYGRDFRVCWYGKRPNLRAMRKRGEQAWLGNIYLNAIFTPNVDPAAFDPIRREYSRSLVPWRRPLQQVYVSAATSRWGAPWLAQVGLGVSPPIPNAETKIILGGNNKIRLLDQQEGLAFGILKEGFNPTFIQREIETRRLAEECGVPVPSLVNIGADNSWFSERYVTGTPINRLRDQGRINGVVQATAQSLHRLYDRTRQIVPLLVYVDGMQSQIQSMLEQNHLLSEQQKRSLLGSLDAILERINELGGITGDNITTAISHGDFQPANILVNQDDVWLIDWEYSARRQAGYDVLVYALRSRFPQELSGRLKKICQDGKDMDPTFAGGWPDLEWQKQPCRCLYLSVFLLEEMALYLDENTNSSFKYLNGGIVEFLDELAPGLKILDWAG